MERVNHLHRHGKTALAAGFALLATTLALGPAASGARADDTPQQQEQKTQSDKNTMRGIGIGAGALGAWELLHGRGTNALILGAGAAYAGKRYEDDRKKQAAEDQAREQRRLGAERQRERDRQMAARDGEGSSSSAEMPAVDPIHVYVNGDRVPFADGRPEMTDDAVYVPMRGVLERLGATVQWDSAAREVIATRGGKTVTLPLDGTPRVNGERIPMNGKPAYINDGHTMVPLRFVAQSFGANVDWDAHDRDVRIATR